jgi:uncharacterized protein
MPVMGQQRPPRKDQMLTVEAQIETDRGSRYLVRICKHAASMGDARGHRPRVHLGGMLAHQVVQVQAEWSDARGTVTFSPGGQCTMQANASMLTVRIEATDEESLQRIQDILSRDIDRFGRRDQLKVNWHRPEEPGEGQ